MQRTLQALCFLLLLASSNIASAQVVLRFAIPFARPRISIASPPKADKPSPAAATVAAAAPLAAAEAVHPADDSVAAAASDDGDSEATVSIASLTSSSGSSAAAAADAAPDASCPPNWALQAIGATTTATTTSGSSSSSSSPSLPTSTDRVLICLISSGVHTDAPALKHNRFTGCAREDPLDPTGCTLPWANKPSAPGFKSRGTWLASILAAQGGGVIPGATDIHVVPVDGPGTGAVDPHSSAPSGKSRLRAYSVCEGRLRGLQAAEYGSTSSSSSSSSSSSGERQAWRMVMLVDVAADRPANSGTGEYALSEADWFRVATGSGLREAPHAPDVLVIAPAGPPKATTTSSSSSAALSYPAALPGVLSVGGFKCSGEPLTQRRTATPAILAPGGNIGIPGTDRAWSDDTAAAAIVAGAAARLWTAYPGCSADDIRAALQISASGVGQSAVLSLAAAEAALQLSPCGKGAAVSRR